MEEFSEAVFESIIALIKQEEFRGLKETHWLLMLFEYDWGRLTGSQRDRLLFTLKAAYGKYADWMSDFVTSELLGEYYCNKAAFFALTRLQNISNEGARAGCAWIRAHRLWN